MLTKNSTSPVEDLQDRLGCCGRNSPSLVFISILISTRVSSRIS